MIGRVARYIYARPLLQLVVGAVVVAAAFPASSAGAIALAILAGAAGVGALRVRWPRIPAWIATAGVLLLIVVLGFMTFGDALAATPDWQLGDWGPQHAVLARIMPALPGLDVPVWNHAVSTGDAPLELYPALTYLLTGHVALVFSLDVPSAFMLVAVVVHILLAVLTAVLAMRVASRKVACVLGVLWLVDSGAVSHGGTVGLFRWAILHSALADVFCLVAMLGVMMALRRPRLGASITIWIATALATATHPSALLMFAAAIVALVGVALLASDIRPRVALVAIAHLLLGVALGAVVWLPASERLVAYGQHFANDLYSATDFLRTVMTLAMPMTAYSLVVYAGYIGLVVGLFSRRAEVVFVSVVAFVLMLGICELPYLSLGLVPGQESGRIGALRMMLLVRPFMFVAAAYLFSLLGAQIVASLRAAPHRQRIVAAALLGVVGGVALRVVPVYWREESQRAYEQTQAFAPDPEGRRALVAWAKQQAITPDRWARALFEQTTHDQLHLTAETGLPTVHIGALPDLLLRQRIVDTTPASLRRFNIRWVVGVGKSPSLGDPATEKTLGTYRIREVTDWDGKFARVERGTGNVIVHRLDDRAVEVELIGTERALIVLGTGYYPRWRASNATVQPFLEGRVQVVSAWLSPGRTTFTVDAPLPSDGAGRIPAVIALIVCVAIVLLWSRRRVWTLRKLSRMPRVRIPLVVIIPLLFARGCFDEVRPARAFLVGTGIRPVATVEARSGGDWTECDYAPLRGEYDCDGLVIVTDTTATLVNDAPPSWPFITPAVIANAYGPGVEVRIRRKLALHGRYWAAASHPTSLSLDGREHAVKAQETLVLDDRERMIEWRAKLPYPQPLHVVLVAEDALMPP